jgi:hypothetical protein
MPEPVLERLGRTMRVSQNFGAERRDPPLVIRRPWRPGVHPLEFCGEAAPYGTAFGQQSQGSTAVAPGVDP